MIEEVIDEIVTKKNPSPRNILETFKNEAELRFQETLNLVVSITNDTKCLLVLSGKTSEPASSLEQIEDLVIQTWKRLAYKNFEASACEPYREAVGLRFITCPRSEDYFVTGLILVKSAEYQHLVEAYFQKYSGLSCINSTPARWASYIPA